MAFNKKPLNPTLESSIAKYLGLTIKEIDDIMTEEEEESNEQGYEADASNTEDTSDSSYGEVIDLDELTAKEKAAIIVHSTLDKLITGDIVIEDAQELATTVAIVDSFDFLDD